MITQVQSIINQIYVEMEGHEIVSATTKQVIDWLYLFNDPYLYGHDNNKQRNYAIYDVFPVIYLQLFKNRFYSFYSF